MTSERLQIRYENFKAAQQKKPRQQSPVAKFSNQKVELDKAPLFFPPGYENFFLLLYFITLPYITGLIFIFVYVGKAKMELFSVVSEKSSFIFIWAIGYEILAAIFFLFIAKLFIDSLKPKPSNGRYHQKFRRP